MNLPPCSKSLTLAMAFAMTFLFFIGGQATVEAKSKRAKYGTIKILSTPGGLPVAVDGKSFGATTTDYRAIDLEPGLHSIDVTLPNGQHWTRQVDLGAGRIKCIAVKYKPVPIAAKSPCPFPTSVSGPATINEGDIITYQSNSSYGGSGTLKYEWTVNPANARIISGAGTPTITVDSTGLGGQRITATLVMTDGSSDEACRQVAQSFTEVPAQVKRVLSAREYDTCESCSYDDQKARLDNVVVELQNDPSTSTYLFAYGGRHSRTGVAERLLERAKDYLITKRGIDASRIVVANGGLREEDSLEVWIVPQGAKAPQPRPTLQPQDVRPGKNRSGTSRPRP